VISISLVACAFFSGNLKCAARFQTLRTYRNSYLQELLQPQEDARHSPLPLANALRACFARFRLPSLVA
jgi:hypothetical protein